MQGRIKAILIGGVLGGAFDLAFALVSAASNGIAPARLLQIIASGAFGNAAMDMGAAGSASGALFHFGLSLLWAALFAMIAARFRAVSAKPWLSGPIFGVIVFFAMRLVVLPLSAYPNPVRFAMPGAFYDLLSHMFLFGLPIALANRAFASRR